MEKFKTLVKENYKIIIPIALIIVLFVSFIIYYKVAILSSITKETKDSFYQYFYDKKYNYEAIVSTNRKDVVVDFKPQEIEINLDSTPIYYEKEEKVIFPKDMSIIMPTINCAEYLSTGYSYISYKNKNYVLTTNKYSNKLGKYVLYDGSDLYFFVDEAKLTIEGQEVTLSPMSYVIAKYNKYISYYDKKSDTFKTITTTNNDATISNSYYTIEVSKDRIDYYGTSVILTSEISNLNTIDKKG